MKSIHVSKLSLLAALVLLAPLAARAQALPADAARGFGDTLEELTVKWWQQVYALESNPGAQPPVVHPLNQDGAVDCRALGTDRVVFLGGAFGDLFNLTNGVFERECSIPAGMALLVPILNNEWSAVEAEMLLASRSGEPAGILTGLTEADLRVSSAAFNGSATARYLFVDGRQVPDSRIYWVSTRLFTFELPASNLLGYVAASPPTTSDAVADGYYALLPPLSPGRHVIRFGGTYDFTLSTLLKDVFPFSFSTEATYVITVVGDDRAGG